MDQQERDEILDALDVRLEKSKEAMDDVPPEFPTYQELREDKNRVKKEMTIWGEELSKNSRYHSEIKSDIVYINELIHKIPMEMSRRESEQFIDKIEQYLPIFEEIEYAVSKRIRNIEKVIDLIRSLQSHMYSQPNF